MKGNSCFRQEKYGYLIVKEEGTADGVLVYDKDVLTQGFGGKILL